MIDDNGANKNASSVIRRVWRAAGRQAKEEGWSNPFIVAMALGLAATLMVAWTQTERMHAVATALFVALASVACGALLGFLFGIPRAATGDNSGHAIRYEWQPTTYTPNTNLEQISDWLTKIVVAIGLAQLAKIPDAYQSLAQYVASSFGSGVLAPGLAALMLAYFAILGFLITYLWTRLFLSGEFNKVDGQATRSPEFLEGLIQALLYQSPPEGYSKALEYCEQYRSLFGDQNWRIWRSLACAYGQQYSDLPDDDRNGPKGQEVRARALAAVKRVLNLNPQERNNLFSLWDEKAATPRKTTLLRFTAMRPSGSSSPPNPQASQLCNQTPRLLRNRLPPTRRISHEYNTPRSRVANHPVPDRLCLHRSAQLGTHIFQCGARLLTLGKRRPSEGE